MSNSLVDGFDEEVFRGVLNAKFGGSFSASRASILLKKEDGWERAERLGIVKALAGPGGANMPLLVVAAKLHDGDTLKERSSRIRQFKFAKQTLDQAMADPPSGVEGVLTQGLFVFHDDHGNFRLSLVHGRAEDAKLVWSTAKRLSFYVEAGHPNKTFRDRMALDWSAFDKLKDAFSVEKLTKEFYNRLFAWYQWALSDEMNVTYPNRTDTDDDDREINEHIIRLITRLMFVWFLKQKHLVPDNLFDPAKLKGILKSFDPLKGDNYYRAILQNLFFATLNSEIPERAFAVQTGDRREHFDIKTLYRYGPEFALPEKDVLKLFEKIPFLNGGLFECLDRGKNYSDGFSRNSNKQARLPNRLFFDEAQGLIPLLSQYNFTVEENSPGDEEVALDPELLGKVFENLLGAYNPETKVAARNATGSFYTPREIVNYMVDESLIAHLKNVLTTKYAKDTKKEDEQKGTEETKEDEIENKLRKLFAGTEGNPFGKEETAALDRALVTAKMLDPACGSGAFPMGILLRMVELLRILRGIPEDQSVYDLKLELIENCIYGGDIQCIAVQISKLRFFISLVCEQKPTSEARKNYGINPLPNLETKFVAADSLIGLPRSGDALPMQNVEKLKKELWSVRHRHFLARSYQEKKELRKEDKKLRTELAKALEEGGGFDTDSARLMAEWDPYDQNTSAPFYDPEWMFNVRDGFDVVIGNPPYLRIQGIRKTNPDLADILVRLYVSATGSFDIYVTFAERALQLAGSKGFVNFIMPVKWVNAAFGTGLRKVLLKDRAPWKIINFGAYQVFNASTYTGLQWFKRNSESLAYHQLDKDLQTNDELGEYLRELDDKAAAHIPITRLSDDAWVLSVGEAASLLDKLNRHPRRVGDIFAKIFQGLATSKDDVYFLNDCHVTGGLTKGYSKFLDKTVEMENGLLKPVLKGDDVHRYENLVTRRSVIFPYTLADEQATLLSEKEVKRLFPEGYAYLKACENELRAREKGRFNIEGEWFQFGRKQGMLSAENEKLVAPDISLRGNFAYDSSGVFYSTTTIYGYIKKSGVPESYKCLLAVLNSELCWWFLTNTGTVLANGYFRFKPDYIKPFPVPSKFPPEMSSRIEALVDRILAAKKADPSADTSALEAEIDQMVYELYGLTPEEIAIVEGSGQKSSASTKATADKNDGEMDEAEKPKKKRGRKAKAVLPASLPGWD